MDSLSDRVIKEETFGLAGWTGESRGMKVAHQHRDLELNYVLRGSMTYLVAGRLIELPQRRICLLWGGVPHQMIRKPEAVDVIWLTIPLATVLKWGLPEKLIRPLLAAGFVADSDPRTGDFELLSQWLIDLPGRGERERSGPHWDAMRRTVLLEIQARLRRFALAMETSALNTEGGDLASVSDIGLTAVEAMAQFISRNFHNDIGISDIADEAHLHPNYAMTLFKKHTGLTLSQYLLLQRIAHAQRLLATTDDGVAAIAAECGFGSISRFYEAFRGQTGESPRRFRLQLAPAFES